MKIWKGHSQLSKSEVKTLLNTKSIIRWCRADPFRVTPGPHSCIIGFIVSVILHHNIYICEGWAGSSGQDSLGSGHISRAGRNPLSCPAQGRHACPGAAAHFLLTPFQAQQAWKRNLSLLRSLFIFFNKPFLPYLQFLRFFSQSLFLLFIVCVVFKVDLVQTSTPTSSYLCFLLSSVLS